MNDFSPTPVPRIGQGGAAAIVPAESLLVIRDTAEVSLLSRYLRIARRWKWAIVGSVLVCLAAALIITVMMTRMYSATTTIEIAREDANIVNIEGVQPEAGSLDQEFYQTQYGLLQSESLAQRVASELRLHEDRAFLELYGIEDAGGGAASGRPLDRRAASRDRRLAAATAVLLANVDVTPVRASRLVNLSFTSPDPALSARIANGWSQFFIETNIERRFGATAYARNFLEKRLAEVRSRLDQSERQLVNYAANQRIINVAPATGVDNEGGEGERSIVAEDLSALNASLARARSDRINAQSAYEQVQRGGGGSTAAGLTNTAISSIRNRRAEVAAEYARLSAQFAPAYPQVQALAAELRQLDQSIVREEARVSTTIQGQYNEAVSRERALESRVEALKSDVLDLRRRSIQYNILQREVDTNRTLYDGLLQRYKEIGIAGGIGNNNISIVDQAKVPNSPSSPRPFLNMLLGLVAGLIIGFALALALEQVDEAITDPGDLETTLGIPSLGVVPKHTAEDPLTELQNRRSELTEAYLSIKTNIQFSTANGVPRSLLITSTRAAEGKSTSALALTIALARQGRRVLLIDADMRSPSIHGRLALKNEVGLSSVLSGNETPEAAIQAGGQENMWVLSAGPTPPNAAELLSGARVEAVLAEVCSQFDHVIIDAPPMLGLADAPLLASRVEGVVYVVESRGVRSRLAKVALSRLQNSNAHILGAILTKFESGKANYGYGYDYGYGYGRPSEAKD